MIALEAPWIVVPFFILMLPLAWVAARVLPFYRHALALDPSQKRFDAIDGLRGFLALAVLLHHAVVNHNFYQTGKWNLPDTPFFVACGRVAVAQFFIITGFLFWLRCLKGKLKVRTFYVSRLLRIAPLYLLSAAVITGVAVADSGCRPHVPLSVLARQGFRIISGGALLMSTFNGVDLIHINAGVTWTLGWEWEFYLVLPLLALAALPRAFPLLPAMLLLLLSALLFHDPNAPEYTGLFIAGMIAAQLVHRWPALPRRASFPLACAAVVSLVLLAFFVNTLSLGGVALCFCLFLPIAYGQSFFGLLTSAPARLLGTISYSVYLLHGLVLFALLALLNRVVPIPSLSPMAYWAFIFLAGVVTIMVALLTYRAVEYPFIEWGRKRQPARATFAGASAYGTPHPGAPIFAQGAAE